MENKKNIARKTKISKIFSEKYEPRTGEVRVEYPENKNESLKINI